MEQAIVWTNADLILSSGPLEQTSVKFEYIWKRLLQDSYHFDQAWVW